jgi:AcrR family transcriptional regulator
MVARTRSVEVEAAVLEAAQAILLAEGPDSLSVRHLATTAGVAPMSVYNHFGSKNGVVEALFVAGFARLESALRSVGEIADPTEALLEAGRRYRRLALEQPATYEVMFGHAVPGYSPGDAAVAVSVAAFGNLVSAVERAMAAGVLAPLEPGLAAQMIWSSIHGWVSIELRGISFIEDQEAGVAAYMASVLRGLGARC